MTTQVRSAGTGVADEGQQLKGVVKSLAAAFPDIPLSRISAEVEDARASFAGAKIRTYVPVLIQHKVRQQLARLETA